MGKKKPNMQEPKAPAAFVHNPFASLAAVTPARANEPPTPPGAAEPDRACAEASGDTSPSAADRTARAPAKKPKSRLVLRRETKRRAGKAVIVISGFSALPHFDEAATRALAQQLKQQLGCGGSVEQHAAEREIVLQGDRAAKVAELLRALGFRVDGVTS
jgi:translation initiation factor 1 (eIF-1/SUI1)